MRIIKLLTFLNLLIIYTSCNGQIKPIGEEPLELANFDFNTKFTTLLPDKNKSKNYDGYYEVKSELIEVDTIKDDDFNGSEKPIRIEYREKGYSSGDTLATFEDFDFNAINLVTTLDGNIMVVNALIGEISLKETHRFIKLLDRKFGKSKKTKGEFIKPFDIYTWEFKDRFIKYCVVGDDESNTLKIVVDKENNTIENGKRQPHLGAYIYLIKKEYSDKVIGKMGTGDLIYCD